MHYLVHGRKFRRRFFLGAPPKKARLRLVLFVIGTIASVEASALEITYNVAEIAPGPGGESRWEYTYLLSGDVPSGAVGLTLYFPNSAYGVIETPNFPGGARDAIRVQADGQLPASGFVDVQPSLVSGSSFETFTVAFAWTATSAPLAQPFEVYDATYSPIQAGSTTVPEPSFVLGVAAGVCSLVWRRRGLLTLIDAVESCSTEA